MQRRGGNKKRRRKRTKIIRSRREQRNQIKILTIQMMRMSMTIKTELHTVPTYKDAPTSSTLLSERLSSLLTSFII
jgi:hypothetical protein